MTLTIVYDNNKHDPGLKTEWGFACLVEFGDHTILFDTGGDGATLLGNMDKLGLDPRRIETVVLSHIHGDHTGGLDDLLALWNRSNDTAASIKTPYSTGLAMHNDVTVYVPRSFPDSFKMQVQAAGAELVEVSEPVEIVPGVYSTGEVKGGILKQALVVTSAQGLVVPPPHGRLRASGHRAHGGTGPGRSKGRHLPGTGWLPSGGQEQSTDQPHRRPPPFVPPNGGERGGEGAESGTLSLQR